MHFKGKILFTNVRRFQDLESRYDPRHAYFLYPLCKVYYIQISFGKNSSYGLE